MLSVIRCIGNSIKIYRVCNIEYVTGETYNSLDVICYSVLLIPFVI